MRLWHECLVITTLFVILGLIVDDWRQVCYGMATFWAFMTLAAKMDDEDRGRPL